MVRRWQTFIPYFFLIASLSVDAQRISSGATADFRDIDKRAEMTSPPMLPTVVEIGVKLLRVLEIEPASVESPKITAEFKIYMKWRDERLKAPEWEQHKVHLFQEQDATDKLSEMFDPRVKIVDGTSELLHQHLRILANGEVDLRQALTITVPADMNLLRFPFDSQLFNFRFSSTYWDHSQLNLKLDRTVTEMATDAAPPSWTFDYSGYHVTKSRVRAHSQDYYVFNFMIYGERDPRNFIWRLLLPLIAIVILSWNVFWMYEDSSSAFANCIVFLLTVVAFHQIANQMLPMIPSFTFMDSIVFISYGYIIIPTFQVMVTTKLEAQGRNEDAESIRAFCRWAVPIGFVLTMLATTLGYYAAV